MTEGSRPRAEAPEGVATASSRAFDDATRSLAMEGIRIDAEKVPPLVAYRDGTMTFQEACEAMRRRHSGA